MLCIQNYQFITPYNLYLFSYTSNNNFLYIKTHQMLQFVNSTVFLSKSHTQKKIIHDKKSFNKNLIKSPSFTNSMTNFQNKIAKPTLQLENIPKTSIKQKIFAKTQKDYQQFKKPFQNIQNTRVLTSKKLPSAHKQRNQISFNPIQKQNIEVVRLPSNYSQHQQKRIKQKSTFFAKKRLPRRSNTMHRRKEDSLLMKKSGSFIGHKLVLEVKKLVIEQQKQQQINGRNLIIKEELYYVDQLKRQIKRVNLFQKDDNDIVPMIIGHFFQSISSFYKYKQLKQPDQAKMSIFLPKQRRLKTTLIFDMDETLIHAQPYQKDIHSNSWGQNFEVIIDDGSKVMINLKIRPFALQVLQRLKQRYQIGIFTAANETYARQIIQKIDPLNKLIDFKLYRQHCDIINGKLAIKDLRILSNRSIKNIILIDNSPHTYLYQLDNAIPIISFYSNQQDQQLLKLERFIKLQCLDKKDDIRPILKNIFHFHKYIDFDNIEELVDTIYAEKA